MNFLFPEHGLIFIHIPKNAGTSIRGALGGLPVGPVAGTIPDEWKVHPSFTVVRHPIDRFLSAVNMFRAGARNIAIKDHYREPRLPGLTPTQALDVLEDPEIGYDRTVRNPLHNLKHHLWPQTEAFNCLHLAERVLRYERLEEDFQTFCNLHRLNLTLPYMRQTSAVEDTLSVDDLTTDELDRIATLFRADFEQLGYDPEDLDMCRLPGRSATIMEEALDAEFRVLWAAYFDPLKQADPYGSALPAPDVDLAAFAAALVPGVPEKGWTGRKGELREHFQHLEPEFSGKPRICHLLACTIVVLRRDVQDPAARKLFTRIVREHGGIAEHLNSRWLTSVCDTLVDVADNDVDKVLGLTGTLFSNSMKLVETQIRSFYPERPWPPRKRLARGGPLYDGMISFWLERGDAIENLFDRIERALSVPADGAPFVREIVDRVIGSDTALSRIMSLAGQQELPLVRKERIERLRQSMADL